MKNGLLWAKRVLFLFVAVSVGGTWPAAGAAEQSAQPTLRVSARLVSVDVTVMDGSGHAVPGLTVGDFVLKENGREQRILSFEEESGSDRSLAVARADRGRFQYTNVPRGIAAGAITLILFDGLNTPTTEQPFAQRELVRFLRQLPEGQGCALFALRGRLELLQNVTADKSLLLLAAQHLQVRGADLVESASSRGQAEDGVAQQQRASGPLPSRQSAGAFRDEVISYQARAARRPMRWLRSRRRRPGCQAERTCFGWRAVSLSASVRRCRSRRQPPPCCAERTSRLCRIRRLRWRARGSRFIQSARVA